MDEATPERVADLVLEGTVALRVFSVAQDCRDAHEQVGNVGEIGRANERLVGMRSKADPVAVTAAKAVAARMIGLEEPHVAVHRLVPALEHATVAGAFIEDPRHDDSGIAPGRVTGAGPAGWGGRNV